MAKHILDYDYYWAELTCIVMLRVAASRGTWPTVNRVGGATPFPMEGLSAFINESGVIKRDMLQMIYGEEVTKKLEFLYHHLQTYPKYGGGQVEMASLDHRLEDAFREYLLKERDNYDRV